MSKHILNFRDFPEIPEFKRWQDGKISTLEQDLGIKVFENHAVTLEEEIVLQNALTFYKELFHALRKANYNTFSQSDFSTFRAYIQYALPHLIMVGNSVQCPTVTRVVKNKSVLGEEKSLPNLKFLTYPTLDVVRKHGRYNRANTPETNTFYGADSLDTALMELQPGVGEMITCGVWEKIDQESKVYCYPIIHGKQAIEVNDIVKRGYQAFQDLKASKFHQYEIELAELVLDFLGHEFSKKVENHCEYFFSAVYSEMIFGPTGGDTFNAIIYPSVQNGYSCDNLAMRPSYFDKHYRIQSVTELVVTETNYDKERPNHHYTGSFYIKGNYNRHIRAMLPDGTLVWKDPIPVT